MENEKSITFKLSEHDASQLLALVKKEIKAEEKVWQPYWTELAELLEQAIEYNASVTPLQYGSYFKDKVEGESYSDKAQSH